MVSTGVVNDYILWFLFTSFNRTVHQYVCILARVLCVINVGGSPSSTRGATLIHTGGHPYLHGGSPSSTRGFTSSTRGSPSSTGGAPSSTQGVTLIYTGSYPHLHGGSPSSTRGHLDRSLDIRTVGLLCVIHWA